MNKILIIALGLLSLCLPTNAQKDTTGTTTLTAAQSKELMKDLKIDAQSFLKLAAKNACLCIDSINVKHKSSQEITEKIAACIDNEVSSYQISSKLLGRMTDADTDKDKVISINTDKNTEEYQSYYFELERWLRDSCPSLKSKITVEDKVNENSVSDNDKAIKEYNKGTALLGDKNFKKALPYFEKSVKIDPKFAFAWDNIGICQRQLGNYDEAIAAYKKSLELDPKGITPLHNLPVAYELKKDYDNAIIHYENIAKIVPEDPETYYGLGRIYTYFKIDLEKGLAYFCIAYNAYVKQNSPYRTDAEKNIGYIYGKMKEAKSLDAFKRVLKKNNINAGID